MLTVLGLQNRPLPASKSIIFSMLRRWSLESLIDTLKRGVNQFHMKLSMIDILIWASFVQKLEFYSHIFVSGYPETGE